MVRQRGIGRRKKTKRITRNIFSLEGTSSHSTSVTSSPTTDDSPVINNSENLLSTPAGNVNMTVNESLNVSQNLCSQRKNDINPNSDCDSDTASCMNDHPHSNNYPPLPYSTKRRHVRKLKDFFKTFPYVTHQASILLEFLNETDVEPILRAGGMIPPKESTINS